MATVIIGAGVAGLTCAKYLNDKGIEAIVLEASDAVGGRVRTDVVDGFRLDRGFQVLLTSYPEAMRLLDYDSLKFRHLPSGARIRSGREMFVMPNPLKDIFKAPQALFSPVGGLADKIRVLHLNLDTRETPEPSGAALKSDITTLAFLRDYGYTEQMIERFFVPFFRGVFLEGELATGSSFFKFLYGMFSKGDVVVPENGMQAIPEQIAARLADGVVRLNTPVAKIDGRIVTLANGETIEAENVVIATDAPAAAKLLGKESATKFNGTVCLYFESDAAAKNDTPYLVINSNHGELIDHAIAISDVAPNYAPAGKTLLSVSLVGNPAFGDAELVAKVRSDLGEWFGANRDWRHLKTYRIPHSLPQFLSGGESGPELKIAENVYRCGDYAAYPSLNAAMKTGRIVAEMIAG